MKPAGIGRSMSCALGDFHFQHLSLCVMYGCSQPRELWFIDLIMYIHVHVHVHVCIMYMYMYTPSIVQFIMYMYVRGFVCIVCLGCLSFLAALRKLVCYTHAFPCTCFHS